MKQAVFRLDAGKQTGLGHLMRCLALAEALSQEGVECSFACKNIASDISVSPHRLITIQNEDEFFALSKSFELIIIDHYGYTSEELYILSRHKNSRLVVLDDEGNRGNLYADVIINPLLKSRAFTSYHLSADVHLLSGPEYCLLGGNFQELVYPDVTQRETIIITFGGADTAQLTLPVLKAITDSPIFKSFKILAVTGASCSQVDEIEQYCQQNNYIHKHNVKNMAQLFTSARLAISAAGSSIFELACCGVPAVLAIVADNQLFAAREHSALGWCRSVDCRTDRKIAELLKQAELLLAEDLEQLSQQARTLVDAGGAHRVAQILTAL